MSLCSYCGKEGGNLYPGGSRFPKGLCHKCWKNRDNIYSYFEAESHYGTGPNREAIARSRSESRCYCCRKVVNIDFYGPNGEPYCYDCGRKKGR